MGRHFIQGFRAIPLDALWLTNSTYASVCVALFGHELWLNIGHAGIIGTHPCQTDTGGTILLPCMKLVPSFLYNSVAILDGSFANALACLKA